MFIALLYLQYHSIKNGLLMRVRRLRQPKYLFGGIVGGLYFYFYFFRYIFRSPGTSGILSSSSPLDPVFLESLGALLLFVIFLSGWILPHQRTSLTFTEAEVAFLFPAPITRRGLIHFKLLRSQTAILFTTLLLAIVTSRLGGRKWIHGMGLWLILSTMNLHMLAASFARTRLLDRGISNWLRRVTILAMVFAFVAAVVLWARHTMPELQLSQLNNGDEFKRYLRQIFETGPVPYLLFPFRLIVRPYLSANAAAFVGNIWPALLLVSLHYLWVMHSSVAFEEASVEASKKLAERVAAIRAGNWRSQGQKRKSKRAPFTLRPTGAPAIALLWKNLISAGQTFTFRIWVILLATTGGVCVGLGQTFGRTGWIAALGMIAAFLVVWSIVFGPQFLRQDFRQDLPSADILKSYPLSGWQLALGELLAPAVILTSIQWFLLFISAALLSQTQELLPPDTTLAVALGAAIILPMLNVIMLQIPNGAVLLFPAWFQVAREGAHGIEATGQRLIFMIGQLLAVTIALIPAAGFFVGIFFILRLFFAVSLVIPAAALVAALILGLEAVLGLMLLGWLFERLDLSLEQK